MPLDVAAGFDHTASHDIQRFGAPYLPLSCTVSSLLFLLVLLFPTLPLARINCSLLVLSLFLYVCDSDSISFSLSLSSSHSLISVSDSCKYHHQPHDIHEAKIMTILCSSLWLTLLCIASHIVSQTEASTYLCVCVWVSVFVYQLKLIWRQSVCVHIDSQSLYFTTSKLLLLVISTFFTSWFTTKGKCFSYSYSFAFISGDSQRAL